MAKRRALSKQLKNQLLVEANHACTICGRPGVQIHHIDGDSANNAEENLIVLCLVHHDEAERSRTCRGLSTNLAPEALRIYKHRLITGCRPPLIQAETPSKINAKLSNVESSQIIIAVGDVTVLD